MTKSQGWSCKLKSEDSTSEQHEKNMKQSQQKDEKHTPKRKITVENLSKEMKARFGSETDTTLCELTGYSRGTVARLRQDMGIFSYRNRHFYGKLFWEKADKLFGLIPDKEIAVQMGCCLRLVRKRRKEIKAQVYRKKCRIDWPKYDKHLGNMEDSVLAKKIGCTPSSIWYRRNQLGILPYYATEFAADLERNEEEKNKKNI